MLRILFIAVALSFVGCSYFVSTDELSDRIELQMQREFDQNAAYQQYHLKIQDFKILERQGTSFKGQATLKYDGQSYQIPVQIYKDVQGYSWKIEESAFAFIDEADVAKYQAQLDEEFKNISAELDHDNTQESVDAPQQSYVGLREEQDASDYKWTEYDDEPFPNGNITVNSP